MEFLDQSFFSEDQKWILHLRINEKMSYSQIQASWKAAHLNEDDENISPSAIKTCFKRSALALTWKKSKLYGKEVYLSKVDIEKLSEYITEKCLDNDPTDAKDVLEEALLIKKERQINASYFLRAIKCKVIAEEIENEDINAPVRTWINSHLEELCCKIRSSRIVDYDRFFACTTQILKAFYQISSNCLDGISPALIFGADELGLDPTLKKKYIIPIEVQDFLTKNTPINFPHFSVMFSHNAIGDYPPPFIIIPDLKNCPDDIKEFISLSKIWCCSTESGWQNRDSFLLWTINFINWLSEYRLKLDRKIQNQKAILIIDGHSSRENPISLYIMKINNIDVLVLPAHTTHLLQMFDVVLAKPFKKLFSRKFNEFFIEKCLLNIPMSSIIRNCAIRAIIYSWDDTCTYENCSKAAEVTGTFPQNIDVILSNPYVHDLNEEEEQLMKKKRQCNRLNINGKLVTDIVNLKEINEVIHEKESFKHLCVTGPVDYIPFCYEMRNKNFNDVILFTTFHHYSSFEAAPIFFDNVQDE